MSIMGFNPIGPNVANDPFSPPCAIGGRGKGTAGSSNASSHKNLSEKEERK
jgi:hypothetical protein